MEPLGTKQRVFIALEGAPFVRRMSILHTAKGKNVWAPISCSLHEASQTDTGQKTETSWEAGGGGHGWIPRQRRNFPKGPTCKRGVLPDEDQSRSQKSWRSCSQKKTGCHYSCFSQNLPMNMKRLAWFNSCYYEAVGADMALTHGSTGWGKRKTKQTTKLTLKERQTERGKEQEQGRAWPGSLLVQKTPVPPVHLLMWRLLIPTAGAGVEGCGRKRVNASTLSW